ncbi:Alpha/Beta hydrolase protein [Lineolata rhizophorae]|uniref:Alpha/Beta hydrolase protein n=1 Tax=Lineolata rhizophorae TaxID=578093 RepID=A0A6A6NYD2_9PEZI|nr:Alpha/Beta hydrolase protein [Lineolata rhizophorae]
MSLVARKLGANGAAAARARVTSPLRRHPRASPPSPTHAAAPASSRWHSTASSRQLHQQAPRQSATAAAAVPEPVYGPLPPSPPSQSTNPALSFPCLDRVESRSATLTQKQQEQARQRRSESGPEPSYTTGKHKTFVSAEPLLLDWGGILPAFEVAYETWGQLNAGRSNAVLLHTGLSASSHAKSTPENPQPGWWEKFIGPGAPLDTNKYFVVCTNVIGGCYGSTGPGSIDPANGEHYATRFPILTMEDMVRAQFRLLDTLGIGKLYASVGSSMGGMQSLAAGVLFPERVGKVVSISGCARSHPYSIAMRHTQRQALMMDPAWSRGFYYNSLPPHIGMKLARSIATVTYRSGPEWEQRFGRRRADPSRPPALCPDFLIETYLDHAGEKWCLTYDANSLLYISKAMDLFDLGTEQQERVRRMRDANAYKLDLFGGRNGADGDARAAQAAREEGSLNELCNLQLPEKPYEEQEAAAATPSGSETSSSGADASSAPAPPNSAKGGYEPPADLVTGLAPLARTPTLVLGVASDILFPAWQQREVAEALRRGGNGSVQHLELGEEKSLFGHDTFLLDLENVGGSVGKFLG